ncbi:MAG: ABC-F type ribosomal protection protein [Bacillota bacterium]|jgi:macrolide transport system ATP-binding/permease protein|nr:ABC-F type ribosomal protection protein [Bacillota bacterium]
MLLLEAKHLQKYYGDRLVLDVPDLKLYGQDRIGVVGANGAGKTTLLELLSGRLTPHYGSVTIHGSFAYLSQLDPPRAKRLDPEMAAKFSVPAQWHDQMSGGEKTRFKLAQIMGELSCHIIFADEPTSNLDIDGIELLENMLESYNGALMIVAHDRDFLDRLCNKILEVEAGRIHIYPGNYSDYAKLKAEYRARMESEYQQYVKEKQRLEAVAGRLRQQSQSIKGPPKRMGISEARLHKMGGQKAKTALDRAVKNVEKRIERLEVKARPREIDQIKMTMDQGWQPASKIIVSGAKVNKAFGERIIFRDARFQIYTKSKVALIGPNGCGKSTLVKMILAGESGIRVAKGARIGYFSQAMDILNEQLSVLDNVMETSVYDQTTVRIILARLLFKRDDVYKPVAVLSGGERVKAAFAKILTQDFNFLILDEPTNFLDVDSLEAVEDTFRQYEGSMLFVTHDRRFISAVASQIMTIEDCQIHQFAGTYREYVERAQKPAVNSNAEQQIMVLENRLAEVVGRLSVLSAQDDRETLEREYVEILAQLKDLRK